MPSPLSRLTRWRSRLGRTVDLMILGGLAYALVAPGEARDQESIELREARVEAAS